MSDSGASSTVDERFECFSLYVCRQCIIGWFGCMQHARRFLLWSRLCRCVPARLVCASASCALTLRCTAGDCSLAVSQWGARVFPREAPSLFIVVRTYACIPFSGPPSPSGSDRSDPLIITSSLGHIDRMSSLTPQPHGARRRLSLTSHQCPVPRSLLASEPAHAYPYMGT